MSSKAVIVGQASDLQLNAARTLDRAIAEHNLDEKIRHILKDYYTKQQVDELIAGRSAQEEEQVESYGLVKVRVQTTGWQKDKKAIDMYISLNGYGYKSCWLKLGTLYYLHGGELVSAELNTFLDFPAHSVKKITFPSDPDKPEDKYHFLITGSFSGQRVFLFGTCTDSYDALHAVFNSYSTDFNPSNYTYPIKVRLSELGVGDAIDTTERIVDIRSNPNLWFNWK